jgi:hypothetical protein
MTDGRSGLMPDARSDRWAWQLWAVAAAFGTYFCMYAFRKPFTAAGYEDQALWGIDYKTILVTSQVFGYTLSKFLGIKVVSEMLPRRRAVGIVLLIGLAQLALLLFAVIPPPYNLLALFANGLPLGMVFGLVLGFLEGRRLTEALAAGLCASFILAGGVTQTVGALLLEQGVSQYWMPATAGLLFIPPLAVCVWMLHQIPAPSAGDIAERSLRTPINRAERWAFFGRYAWGLIPLLLVYLLITVIRSIRSDFAPEIWAGLRADVPANIFARTESVVAVIVLVVNGLSVLIRDNGRAFFTSLAVSLGGVLLFALALTGLQLGLVGGFSFMVLVGLGLYLPYVAVHTTVFERLISLTRGRANIGFLMYLADATGYLGFVGVMLTQGILQENEDMLGFFVNACWVTVVVSAAALGISWSYFAWQRSTRALTAPQTVPLPAEE